jgi:hypothetical protein
MDGSGTASTGKRTLTKALGDEAADLTFIPLPTPCRMIDTRVVGGRIAANSTRHYNIAGQPNFQTYGGDAGDCGLINASMAAIAVNITSVGPSQSGFLRAYPFGGTVPSVATLGYVLGQINDNFAIVPLDQSAAADELSIYSFAQTDIVVDAVGYFIRPQATALECTNVTASDQIAANTVGTVNSATCPADYNLTGGGCDSTVPTMTQTNVARPVGALNGDFFRCVIRNNNGSPITATAYGRCCRTPGR